MSNEISREASWAFASDKLGRWLLHIPSGVVGKVSEVHAPGEYLSSRKAESGGQLGEEGPLTQGCDLGERYVSVAVIGFEDGNSFLAIAKNFQILGEGDVQVFLALTQGIRDFVTVAAMTAANTAKGCTPEGIAAVTRAALQAQLRALAPR